MTGEPIRVLLAEDQGMMRGAPALLLGMEDDIEVVARVAAGDAILDAALAHLPDVALLDIELPGRSGLDAAADLRVRVPGCRVLILTTFGSAGPNPLTARESDALKASADGATDADIAARLHLSESTVRNYLSSAIGKTGTRNRMEALREARRQGRL
ncbi:response regulator transcription factor [Streptomyces luteogriseus]|uniref:response regulator transcription factor n=1 Tax=Streptomyces luteogriseus TaxID=68233 RepID=UPI003825ECA7